jgi:hypothetical protein
MSQFFKFFMLTAVSALVLAGCYPAGPDFTEDLDVVYTTFDDEFDFVSRNTYSMPDQIVTDVQITNSGDTIYEYMKPIYADPILQRIDANMTAQGWTKVDVSANPDVLLMPAGMSSTTYFYSYWYCWWYGGYWGGWGWYYPPYYTVSSYTTGSLIMTIADPNIDSPINRSPTAWIAAMNGLLTYSGDINRVLSGIDQAFEQSPYLKTN